MRDSRRRSVLTVARTGALSQSEPRRGGVDALKRLVREISPDIPAALLLVQHVGLTSYLGDILGRAANMPVANAASGMKGCDNGNSTLRERRVRLRDPGRVSSIKYSSRPWRRDMGSSRYGTPGFNSSCTNFSKQEHRSITRVRHQRIRHILALSIWRGSSCHVNGCPGQCTALSFSYLSLLCCC
ncbi:chemotaxis protein CheB [Mesorhizobium sp. BH1-1-4]|uniref:chemotaxis protein CheB n=1 Tax=Mesorhizobium sp. BH1-1-4 TaxID=2876662 RepID=UPI001CD17716|nr:hypothetical protein [Mesorhizobium sp. BH1-1-4]